MGCDVVLFQSLVKPVRPPECPQMIVIQRIKTTVDNGIFHIFIDVNMLL